MCKNDPKQAWNPLWMPWNLNSDTYRGHQYQAHGSCISLPLLCFHRHQSQASFGTDTVVKSSHFLCNVRKTSRLVQTLLQTVNISRPWRYLGNQAACIPLQPLFYPKTKIHRYVPRLHTKKFQHVQRMSRWNQLNGCEHLLNWMQVFQSMSKYLRLNFVYQRPEGELSLPCVVAGYPLAAC